MLSLWTSLAGGKQTVSMKCNNWKRNELVGGTSKWPCKTSSENVLQSKLRVYRYVNFHYIKKVMTWKLLRLCCQGWRKNVRKVIIPVMHLGPILRVQSKLLISVLIKAVQYTAITGDTKLNFCHVNNQINLDSVYGSTGTWYDIFTYSSVAGTARAYSRKISM
jgi:hypothetical protein